MHHSLPLPGAPAQVATIKRSYAAKRISTGEAIQWLASQAFGHAADTWDAQTCRDMLDDIPMSYTEREFADTLIIAFDNEVQP